jgi:hypothetical protein
VLTIRLLRVPELGFLPRSGQRLGLLAPLCAVPPAQDLRAGPVKIPSLVGIPSGRLPCGGIVLTGWWRLIAHGVLSPRAVAVPRSPVQRTHRRQLRCTAGMKLTYHCYRAVFVWREQLRHCIRGCRDQLHHSPRLVLRFGCDVFL